MWYDTKRGILERMGRGWKDVRYLDKMIREWIVIKKEGRYWLKEEVSDKDIEISELRQEVEDIKEVNSVYRGKIEELNKEIVRLKDKEEERVLKGVIEGLRSEVEELNKELWRKKWELAEYKNKSFLVMQQELRKLGRVLNRESFDEFMDRATSWEDY